MGIGTRSTRLDVAALKVAQKISPIEVDPTGKCDPLNAANRLTHPLITTRLGV